MLDLGAMDIAISLALARRFGLRITAAFHDRSPPTYAQ
jgi:predicted aspartyl protease